MPDVVEMLIPSSGPSCPQPELAKSDLYRKHSGPHYPLPAYTRVQVSGYGSGTYIRFEPEFLCARHRHIIDFDASGVHNQSNPITIRPNLRSEYRFGS
jgi:hypothetical protein